MKIRFLHLWGFVRTSFWFIPGLMVVAAILTAFFAIFIDKTVSLESRLLLYSGGPEGAHSVLTTLASSMITVAGVAFSITMVALALASSQFGPRLIRNFLKDTGNQVVLGTFLATFIYCLLVLMEVDSSARVPFIPSLSISIAVLLALASVAVFIFFIHHVSTSIQADLIISTVYKELIKNIEEMFPEHPPGGHEYSSHEYIGSAKTGPAEPADEEQSPRADSNVEAPRSGYLQAVDVQGLIKLAIQKDLLVSLRYRPGKFIAKGSAMVAVKGAGPPDEELSRQIQGCFIMGSQRTPEQDIEFSIRQLVEVAIRALSPSINDPFTAIMCIDHLGSAICHLAGRCWPPTIFHDREGKPRVSVRTATFEGITNAAFDQIRQYGRGSVSVTIRLMESLTMIASHARNPEQLKAVLRQAEMIARASRSLAEANDTQDVQERYRDLLAISRSFT